MHILHGTWIPEATDDFVQQGGFYLWVETEQQRQFEAPKHNRHLHKVELAQFLANEFGLGGSPTLPLSDAIRPCCFWLPSGADAPLPSLELAAYLESPTGTDDVEHCWAVWEIDCFRVDRYRKGSKDFRDRTPYILQLLPELNFLIANGAAEIQLGADLKFWLNFYPTLKAILLKDQYIPALRYRILNPRSRKKQYEIYHTWEIVSPQYDSAIAQAAEAMPWVCAAGFEGALAERQVKDGAGRSDRGGPQLHQRENLLRHCCEVLLVQLIRQTELPNSFTKTIEGTLVQRSWGNSKPTTATVAPATLETFQQWQRWRDRITETQTALSFNLYFVLQSPLDAEGDWNLLFQIGAKKDPSLQAPLTNYWRRRGKEQALLREQLGGNFEQQLLLNLGYAARIYPKIWQALETERPVGIALDLDEAFEFLREAAWILEDAGYRVVIPAWWTPQGRRRAKVKLRAKPNKASGGGDAAKSYFSVTKLQEYDYDLSIGGEQVSRKEWEQLVDSKSSLVHFRGQWIELDQGKMRELMRFWQEHQNEQPELSVLDMMQLEANSGGDIELDLERDRALATMLQQLQDKSKLQETVDPKGLNGTLRHYQRRGMSWLSYLEGLGLNGCLADDMGLGKTVQVIARLVQEREPLSAAQPSSIRGSRKVNTPQDAGPALQPTLLVAPTSVIGNWRREIATFGPALKAFVHHGSDRIKKAADFKRACNGIDVVITSFTLVRADLKLLQGITWHRIVLDEAQNIKNPKAAQTKAILKLEAPHRLALTGTPVENRLLDLWSIFNFLNPGYLGKENQFRRNFERPIQRYGDAVQATTLKQLVEPFILRRVKTDRSIIKDLPEKVEQKVYCHLTKEQASLYEVVVKDITGKLDETQGMERRGLILGSLTKLKQICNHPAQFLHDGSDFDLARSHKLERLAGMVAEVTAAGDSLLIFTQFREIGDALEQYFRQTCYYNTYWLHGGTSAQRRDRMIQAFQDPETEPSIFILSLKAGGVGITLTKANHVFHFDRWWNPAVEDQATDRAFRIGQSKAVFVHKFVATGTLEERIDEMIEDKKKLAGTVVGSDEAWLTELDTESFKKLIALNRNAVLD